MQKICLIMLTITISLAGQEPAFPDFFRSIGSLPDEERIHRLAEYSQTVYGSNLDDALKASYEALSIADRTGDPGLRSDSNFNLGYLFYRNADYDSSSVYIQRSLVLAREAGDSSRVALAVNRLGNIYTMHNKQTEAYLLFIHAAELHKKAGNRLEEGRAYNNIANYFRQNGNYEKALEYFIEASRLYEEVQYLEGSAWLNFSITMLYRTLGDYEKALRYANRALDTYKMIISDNKDSSGIMICYGQLGDLNVLTKDYEKALYYHEKALAMRIRRNIPSSIADGYTGMGRIYYAKGDYEQALSYLEKSTAIREEENAKSGLATSLKYSAHCYLALHDTVKAEQYYDRALNFARSYNELTNQADILNSLAGLSDARGRSREAYGYARAYQAIRDSINSMEVSKQVMALKASYDLQQSEKENLRLSQENKIKELELSRSLSRLRYLSVITFLGGGLIILIWLIYRRTHRDNRLLRDKNREIEIAHRNLKAEVVERKKVEEEREKLILELQDSLNNVKTLKGLIPICASCKKIRNDEGYYEQLEKYISEHTEAEFSHGICSDCYQLLYPDLKPHKK